jgi:hypothetical protein
MALVWLNYSFPLTKPSGLPDKVVALACGVGQEGAVEHLGEAGDFV